MRKRGQTMDKPDKIKHLKGAVKLWCLDKGYNEIDGADLVFQGENKTVGFILKEGKTDRELLAQITNAKIICGEIYVVITDPTKRAETLKIIPKECGLLCFSDPFGLGKVFQVIIEAKAI